MNLLLTQGDVRLIKSLPLPQLNTWVMNIYKSGFKDGLEKAENDIDEEATIMSCEKVLEKLNKAGYSKEEANDILEVLLND